MTEASNIFTPEFQTLLVALVAALILGAMKFALPLLKEWVPTFMWPIAIIVLAKLGTQACEAMGAACTGNPLSWTQEEASAMAAALIAMVGHHAYKGAKRSAPTARTAIKKFMNGK